MNRETSTSISEIKSRSGSSHDYEGKLEDLLTTREQLKKSRQEQEFEGDTYEIGPLEKHQAEILSDPEMVQAIIDDYSEIYSNLEQSSTKLQTEQDAVDLHGLDKLETLLSITGKDNEELVSLNESITRKVEDEGLYYAHQEEEEPLLKQTLDSIPQPEEFEIQLDDLLSEELSDEQYEALPDDLLATQIAEEDIEDQERTTPPEPPAEGEILLGKDDDILGTPVDELEENAQQSEDPESLSLNEPGSATHHVVEPNIDTSDLPELNEIRDEAEKGDEGAEEDERADDEVVEDIRDYIDEQEDSGGILQRFRNKATRTFKKAKVAAVAALTAIGLGGDMQPDKLNGKQSEPDGSGERVASTVEPGGSDGDYEDRDNRGGGEAGEGIGGAEDVANDTKQEAEDVAESGELGQETEGVSEHGEDSDEDEADISGESGEDESNKSESEQAPDIVEPENVGGGSTEEEESSSGPTSEEEPESVVEFLPSSAFGFTEEGFDKETFNQDFENKFTKLFNQIEEVSDSSDSEVLLTYGDGILITDETPSEDFKEDFERRLDRKEFPDDVSEEEKYRQTFKELVKDLRNNDAPGSLDIQIGDFADEILEQI